MKNDYRDCFEKAVAALLDTGDPAIVYFTRRDLLGESPEPVSVIWNLPEPRKLLRRQLADGSWKGPVKKTPVYPANHSSLVATFKSVRTLVERYGFTRESEALVQAAEFLFTFQTGEGDIRGFIGNQYATYYTGYVLSLLIQAGYNADPRVEKGMRWLLAMRQDDGGWTVPILTRYFDGKTMYRLTSSYEEPVEPDRSRPFSHNWTDMVLRAFAAHPEYRRSEAARKAGELLKSRFFQPDKYSSYKAADYWTRFVHWWPNLLTALESLSLLGFPADDPDIRKGLEWFRDNQQEDGLWKCSCDGKPGGEVKEKSIERAWVTLKISRVMKKYPGGDWR